ncbi:unnamed protein product [Prunus armeniaca]
MPLSFCMASVRHVGDVKYVMGFLIPIAARFPLRVEFDFFLELVVAIALCHLGGIGMKALQAWRCMSVNGFLREDSTWRRVEIQKSFPTDVAKLLRPKSRVNLGGRSVESSIGQEGCRPSATTASEESIPSVGQEDDDVVSVLYGSPKCLSFSNRCMCPLTNAELCEESFSGNECVIKVFRQASTGGGSDLGENGEFDLGISDLGEEGIRHGNRRSKACPTMSLWEVSRNANFMDHFKPKAEISSLPKVKEMCESSKSLLPGLLKKIDRVEEENTKIRAKSSILWAAMLLSWLVVFAMKMN